MQRQRCGNEKRARGVAFVKKKNHFLHLFAAAALLY